MMEFKVENTDPAGNEEHRGGGKPPIDRTVLQKDQDYFADISGLFLFALDEEGKQLTDISGRDMRDTNRIADLLSKRQVEDLYRRVMKTRLEEQIVENTEFSNMKLAAVAIKSNHVPLFCFIVCAVYYDPDGKDAIFNIRSVVDENIFFGGLDYLREIYNRIYSNAALLEYSRKEEEKSRQSEMALSRALQKSEATTHIVELLDSNERFEDICHELVTTAGKSVEISHAYVIAPDREQNTIEVKGRYRSENTDPVIERVDPADVVKYMAGIGDKPMVVSSRTDIEYDFRLWLGSVGIISFVALPVFSGRQPRRVSMYLIFADNDPTRLWSREDIKFFGDTARILQSIYDKRLNKESLTSSYISLKVILNNVGSYILVKDKQSNEILFANKKLEEEFSEALKDGSIHDLLRAETDGNDLRTEIRDEKSGRRYYMNRTVIKWVDGRYAVLYSLFEAAEAVPVTEDPSAETEDQTAAIKQSFSNKTIDPKVMAEFEVYYQPVIDLLKNRKCVAAEALVRWNSRSLGFMLPDSFLPNAKQTGLIIPIGRHVLKEACLSVRKWNESGHPYCKADVNLSAEELLSGHLEEDIRTVLQETGINPKNLTLEIPEEALREKDPGLQELLTSLKGFGCRIAIDDFLAEKESMALVFALPVNAVKLSQETVKRIAETDDQEVFVKEILEPLRQRRVKVCAKGAETEEMLHRLESLQIRYIQGFCIDKAMKKEDFEQKYA